jgi:hypothetical protein
VFALIAFAGRKVLRLRLTIPGWRACHRPPPSNAPPHSRNSEMWRAGLIDVWDAAIIYDRL